MSNDDEMLGVAKVAQMCGVHAETIRRWIKQGCFPDARRGLGKTSPYRVPRTVVEAFIAQRVKELGREGFSATK